MNILNLTRGQYDTLLDAACPNGEIPVGYFLRPETFIFDSYAVSIEGDIIFKINRIEETFIVLDGDKTYLKFKGEMKEKGRIVTDDMTGGYLDKLEREPGNPEYKKSVLRQKIFDIITNIYALEIGIMNLLESRNVSITDLSDVQKVTRVNNNQSKKNKKKSNRTSKVTTLNFSDIEKVVYAKPEVHVPRSYERHTDSWEVRGYVRHYKSGKTVFVKPFTKGKKRDTEKPSEDKIYKVNL
jgi:hypothetical protein